MILTVIYLMGCHLFVTKMLLIALMIRIMVVVVFVYYICNRGRYNC